MASPTPPTDQQQQSTAAQQPTSGQAANVAAVLALVNGIDAARQQFTTIIMNLVAAAVRNFHGWYSTDQITAWTQQLVTDTQPVLAALAGAVDAYMATLTGQVTGTHVRPAGSIDLTQLRAGLTPAGAYGRVADTYRYQQSQADQAAKQLLTASNPTVPLLQAPLDAALQRAADVASTTGQRVTQLQSAKTLQNAADSGAPITGWRRVIHPELSKSGTCGLCVAASIRIYKTDQLMALHTNCHCTVVPVTLANDPGALINERDLNQIYGPSGGNTAALLKKTRWQVLDNGELGPTLTPAGAKQRSPLQVKADTKPAPVRSLSDARKQRQLRALQESLQRSLDRVDRELMPVDPAQWQHYRDTLAARVADLEQQLAA